MNEGFKGRSVIYSPLWHVPVNSNVPLYYVITCAIIEKGEIRLTEAVWYVAEVNTSGTGMDRKLLRV